MPTTTVIDTIHHAFVYDTIHVVIDSSFTPQILRDAQAFYSNSFNWLLGVAGLGVTVFVFVMTLAWNKRLDSEVEKLRSRMDDEVKHVSEMAYNESKKVFEQNVSGLESQLQTMTSKIDSIWSNYVKTFVHQASIAKDAEDCLRFCSFAFKAINCNFNPSLLNETSIMVTIIESRFLDFERPNLNPYLCKSLVNQIEIFESYFMKYFVDKSPEEKEKATNFIGRINTIKDWLSEERSDK